MSMRTPKASRAELYQRPDYLALIARIGANVRRLREEGGFTQEDLAFDAQDMSPAMLRMIELGRVNLTALTLARLSTSLHVDPMELLRATEPLPKRRAGRPKKATGQ